MQFPLTRQIVVFDTETTGVDPKQDKLVELAGASVHPEYQQFTTFCNPGRSIPPEAMAIHHITETDVIGAPSPEDALISFLNHFEIQPNTCYVAHNAKFDKGMLAAVAPVFAESAHFIDTLKLSWLAFPDAPGFSNQVLRYYLNLTVDVPPDLFPHRALYDVIVTRELFYKLAEIFTIEQMIEISSKPVLLPKVTFGKHKGLTWREVPYSYLKWILEKSDIDDENVIHTARYWSKIK